MTVTIAPKALNPSRGLRAVALVALLAALVVWFAGWRGVDYPAQIYRVDLFRRYGLTVWNPNWYGGHYVPGYGLVFPWLASVLTIAIPAIASTVASVVLLGRLLRRCGSPHAIVGASVFAFMMLVNLYEGRLPFALGMMFGLLGIQFAMASRVVPAVIAGALTSLSSPLAGAFLVIVLIAWSMGAIRAQRFRAQWLPIALVLAASATPPVLLALMFPEGGAFPYRGAELAITLVVSAVLWRVLPRRLDAIRWAFAITAVIAVPLFFVPNPVGGNLSRLTVVGAPVVASVAFGNRKLQTVIVLSLVVWQAKPLLVAADQATDPSSDPAYYAPLVEAVEALSTRPVRIEIPLTQGHWEAAYVANSIPIARGWERQLDYRYNAVLYDRDLDVAGYQGWLLDNGVSYVAVPDVRLEPTAEREVSLVARAPYLKQVWQNEHWQLYEVAGSPGLLTGDATLEEMSADAVTIDARSPGPMTLRVRYNSRLVVAEGRGCTTEAVDGWTTVTAFVPGPIKLDVTLDAERSARCPG